MTKEKFLRYAEIKRQLKELKSEADALAPELMSEMAAAGKDKVEFEGGAVTIGRKKTWKFPAEIEAMEADLDEKKKEAQADGSATFEESSYPICRNSEISEQ